MPANLRKVEKGKIEDQIMPIREYLIPALYKKIIPSLRKVVANHYLASNRNKVIFYHDGTITKKVEEHYRSVYEILMNSLLEKKYNIPNLSFEAVEDRSPNGIGNNYTISCYSRKEPFDDNVYG